MATTAPTRAAYFGVSPMSSCVLFLRLLNHWFRLGRDLLYCEQRNTQRKTIDKGKTE